MRSDDEEEEVVTFHVEFNHFNLVHVAPKTTLAGHELAPGKGGKGSKEEEEEVTYPHRLFLEAPYSLELRDLLRAGMAFHLVRTDAVPKVVEGDDEAAVTEPTRRELGKALLSLAELLDGEVRRQLSRRGCAAALVTAARVGEERIQLRCAAGRGWVFRRARWRQTCTSWHRRVCTRLRAASCYRWRAACALSWALPPCASP
jgi:hypothetical protein